MQAEKEAEQQAAADKEKAPKDEFTDQTPYLAPQAEVADVSSSVCVYVCAKETLQCNNARDCS